MGNVEALNAQHERNARALALRVWTRHNVGRARAAGWSLAELAEGLNEKGAPTPRGGRWHKTSVARVVARAEREVVPALDAEGWAWVRYLRDVEDDGETTPAGAVHGIEPGRAVELLEAGDVDLITDPMEIPAKYRKRPPPTPAPAKSPRLAPRG